jgi:hypothetical protein
VDATGRGEDAGWIAGGGFRMGKEVVVVELTSTHFRVLVAIFLASSRDRRVMLRREKV